MTQTPDILGLYHPKSEDDIIELIKHAIDNKLQVRVRGANLSVLGSVYSDNFQEGGTVNNNINMELDQLRKIVNIDKTKMQVTVQGGCNLGYDPFDPSKTSSFEPPNDFTNNSSNNLFYQLNQLGMAIPNVPDIIQQTIAGYISTGSSAGTMQHSFDECILSIRIIDGTGNPQTFTRSEDIKNNPFFGAVVSLGLLGIITEITLQCQPAFNIIGKQLTTDVNDCKEYDFFDTGLTKNDGLQKFLTKTEFTRILWWPYKTLHRAITWQAKTMNSADYNSDTGTPDTFKPQPYKPLFPPVLGSTLPSETLAATSFNLIARWPDWYYELRGNDPETGEPYPPNIVLEKIFPYVYPLLANMFFKVGEKQIFWDVWQHSLPMDTVEFGNRLFQLTYTEMWIPIEQTKNVINTIQAFYNAGGYKATGFYTVEVLAAKKSDFWLSPAYQTDVIRINIMFFIKSSTKPLDFFTQFWDLLHKNNIPFRPHWGKNLPPNTGSDYMQNQYPMWKNFTDLREKMDPGNIFLSTYWKTKLGI